jgi:hypothetical protein
MKRKAVRLLLLLLANPVNYQRAAHPVAAAPAVPVWSLLLVDDFERGTGDWLLDGDWEMQTEGGQGHLKDRLRWHQDPVRHLAGVAMVPGIGARWLPVRQRRW